MRKILGSFVVLEMGIGLLSSSAYAQGYTFLNVAATNQVIDGVKVDQINRASTQAV